MAQAFADALRTDDFTVLPSSGGGGGGGGSSNKGTSGV